MSYHLPTLRNITWIGTADTGCLRLLDQTQLPTRQVYLDCRDIPTLGDAIKRLVVRGAPAIGVAAAYGCVIGAQQGDLRAAAAYLATTRPTAVNLFWALERMQRVTPPTPQALLTEAQRIHAQDAEMCAAIGRHGLELLRPLLQPSNAKPALLPGAGPDSPSPQAPSLKPQASLLTHCNAGALATGGIGTATAPIYLAHQAGLQFTVFVDETRPLLQGARLTAFELQQAGIDVTLICDNMAASVLRQGRVRAVIVGADRIAANGDTANKIGTYSLAVLAQYHAVPFFVAAPSSTFDLTIPDGTHIPIEQRAAEEITHCAATRVAPSEINVYNPAFDVTPHELITAIITERGIIAPVNTQTVQSLLDLVFTHRNSGQVTK